MLNDPNRHSRAAMADGVSYLVGLVESVADDMKNELVGYLKDIRSQLLEAADDDAARSIVDTKFPIEWETSLFITELDLDDDDIILGSR